MKTAKSAITIVIIFCCSVSECRPQASAHVEIVPGKSVAGVELGASLAEFQKEFPRHPDADEHNVSGACMNEIYHWVDVDNGSTGVFALLKSDKIFQLSVQTPRLSLANGIRINTSEKEIKRLYPTGHMYVLLNSGTIVAGNRDLKYWVDDGLGITFELYWAKTRRSRLVSAIDVFPAGREYRPNGCISPPQTWKRLE